MSNPRLPGLELHLPAGASITGADGRLVTELGVSAVPLDRPPFPVPQAVGFGFPVYFTIQPGGAYVSGQGAYLVYPNYSGETPGARMNFWHYDPNGRGWYVYGMGTVTPDGQRIVPDAGVRLYELTGAMVASPSLAPAEGPVPGAFATGGDPVDLGTGLLVVTNTDLALGGLVPMALSRTYRQNDTRSRAFGIGATHPYDVFLVGDISPYTYQELILADGGRVRFNRTSPGTGWTDAVYEHTASPTAFYKAKIVWNGAGWDLTLKDGTVYTFPEGFSATRPQQAALKQIKDRNGNILSLVRDANANLTAIRSPSGRWLELTYDASFRVTQAADNIGRTVGYQYDASGRLWKVTD
ncbi:MAG: RHS repeat domain-containing protein, partial [Candidatus Rokuibacteriota bacterium]